MKEEYKNEAASLFDGTQVAITEEGKKYLGSAIGKQTFIESYVQQKVATWIDELERLIHSNYSTTCSLCCLHTRSDKQMDVSSKNYPKY